MGGFVPPFSHLGLSMADDGTTVLLEGRPGGQTIVGGIGGGENLTLKSTSAETQGYIFTYNTIAPLLGTVDLGTSYYKFRHLHLSGELKGARIESFATANRPQASADTVGRVVWDTDLEKTFVDAGGVWVTRDVERFLLLDLTGWDGTRYTKTYTVDGSVHPETQQGWVDDARVCAWIFRSIDSGEQMNVQITTTKTTVTITASAMLNGQFALIGNGDVNFRYNPEGFDGTHWYSGLGIPGLPLGDLDDFYLETGSGTVFSKATGVWVAVSKFITEGSTLGFTKFIGNLECGDADSVYGGTFTIDGGSATGVFGTEGLPYEQIFNATTSWNSDGGNWLFTVSAATHRRGIHPVVQVKTESGNVIGIETVINALGDVTIKVPVVGDQRFTGSIVLV